MKMLYKAASSPIRSTEWGFRPLKGEEENPEAIKQADFMAAAFPNKEFKRLIKDMTTSIVFGFYLGERYYRPFDYDGKTYLKPMVKYLSQRSIERWMTDRVDGLIGVEQESYGDTATEKTTEFIGRDKLIHFAIDMEGDNFEGISPFRTCLANFRRKNVNYKKIAIGNNFLAIPFIMIEKEKDSGRLDADALEKFKRVLAERAAGDKTLSHIVMPQGYTGNEINSNFDPMKLYQCNTEEDGEMIKSFCANFLLLTGKTGSFALGESLAKFFMQSLDEVAATKDTAITEDLVAPTIRLNFGTEPLIEAYHTEIDQRGNKDLAEVLNTLKTSKAIKQGSRDEAWTREKFGLPERMEDDIVEEPEEQPPPIPGKPGEPPPEPPEENKTEQSKKKELSKSSVLTQAKGSAKRLKKLQADIQAEWEKQLKLIVDAKIKKIKSTPVSYTHLTLPTICSV